VIKITVQYGSEKPLEYLFDQDRLFFGTAEECDVRLREGCGSKLHAQLCRQENQWILRDLNSPLGLQVDGNRVSEISFTVQQAFHIGDVSIWIEAQQQPLGEPEGMSPKETQRSPSKGFMLVPAEPGMPFKAIVLEKQRTLIGRAEEADLMINERSVSRHHAVVQKEELDLGWFVEDLGSHNGTFVNGLRVERETIKPGDEIRFGRIRVHFEDRRDKAPRKTMILRRPPDPEGKAPSEPAPATRLFPNAPQDSSPPQSPPSPPPPSPPSSPPPLPVKAPREKPKIASARGPSRDKTVFSILILAALAFFLALLGLLFLAKSKLASGADTTVPAQLPSSAPTSPPLRSSSSDRMPVWRVDTVPVRIQGNDGPAVTTLSGRVRKHETWSVQAQVQGRLGRISVKPDSVVSRGDILIEMDMSDLERSLQSQKAALNRVDMEIAKERLQAIQEERLKGKASEAQVDSAQRDYDEAVDRYRAQSAEISALEQKLSNDSIRATDPGMVVRIHARQGERVREGQSLLTMRSLGEAIVDADVDDSLGRGCDVGTPVEAMDSHGTAYQGEVIDLLWRGHQMFLKISLQDPRGRLVGGETVRVLVEARPNTASLWVPEKAIFQEQGQPAVFTVEGGHAILCPVTLGDQSEKDVEILEGLSQDAVVIVRFPPTLNSGDPVKAIRTRGLNR